MHGSIELLQILSLTVRSVYGPNPDDNPQLASLIAMAKKHSFPKAAIENAIARGQGISSKGTALESLTVEAIIPPSVAAIIECQTDSKARTLADMRNAIKEFGGSVAPTIHLFERRGKLVFEKVKGLDETEVFDKAIEAEATDVMMEEDGSLVVYAAPHQTTAIAQNLSDMLGLRVQSSDLVWDPKEETKVEVDSADVLEAFLDRIQDDPSVQGIYLNADQP